MNRHKANYTALTPLLFLERAKNFFAGKAAVRHNDVTKTYAALYDDCLRTAMYFYKLGVRPGDRIAYISRNNFSLLEAHYAIPMCGAILVPLNHRLHESEVCYILRHAGVKVLVTEEQYYRDTYDPFVSMQILISDLQEAAVTLPLEDAFRRFTSEKRNEEETISINYTSGTTGHPKGVMYSHRSTYLNAMGECITAGLTSACNYLWVLPLFHCNGWCYPWAVTAVGGTHFFTDSLDPERLVDCIIENRITHLCAAPTVLILLQEAVNFPLLADTGPLTIITAGSAPSPQIINRYEDNNVRIVHVYGLTETHGPHLVCEEKPSWRQGIASVHATFMDVVNNETGSVPWDGKTIGEVVVRGNNVMQGYYRNRALTRQVFKGGWFHTGDLAVVHKDGHIEVVDRIKDIIISGGENISSIEIENALYQHPDILMAAVIPLHDSKWGEVPTAIIELKEGKILHEAEIIDFCRNRLAHYKCPRKVIFDQIPRTATGKVQKNKLKEKHAFLKA